MRVLITGATGFLGGALAHHMLAKGHEIVALGRNPQKLAALATSGATAIQMDLSVPDHTALKHIGTVDAVVHSAAFSAPWGRRAAFVAANVTGTQTAIDFAQALNVRRFVNIASPTVYFAMRDQELVAETLPLPRPINAYAATKAIAERNVLSHRGIGPISLRPRGIYGAGDTTLLPRLLTAAQRGPLPLLRGGKAAIDLTYLEDVITAIQAALTAGPEAEGEVFNISGGEQLPIRDIVETAASYAGAAVTWRPMPLAPVLAAARVLDIASRIWPGASEPRVTPYAVGLFAYRQSLDISKARRILGWSPHVRLAQGVAATFAGETH